MKVSGTHTFAAPVAEVWRAVNDPAVLARTLPGCESLTELGPDSYALRVTAGVAAIKGTYEGTVALADKVEPASFTMTAKAAGAPGTVAADVRVALAPATSGGTELTYDADAVVGGVIGGVGQRMLVGVTRRMAEEFFRAVDADITAGGLVEVSPGPATVYAAGRGRVDRDPLGDRGFVLGLVTGGGLVLVGVLVGWAVGGR